MLSLGRGREGGGGGGGGVLQQVAPRPSVIFVEFILRNKCGQRYATHRVAGTRAFGGLLVLLLLLVVAEPQHDEAGGLIHGYVALLHGPAEKAMDSQT